jgi:glutamine synthetase
MDNLDAIKQVDFIQIFALDLNGRLITLQLNPQNAKRLWESGIGFDGSSIPGISKVDNSDKLLVPIKNSFKLIKFKNEKIGFFIGKIYDEKGVRGQSDIRALLERILIKAKSDFDFTFLVGPEHEFFLLTGDEFTDKIHTDKAGYFSADPFDKGSEIRKNIVKVLSGCGIQFEKAHHEVTNSQHEINLPPSYPLRASDRTILFNYITKKVAKEAGYHATFMPKPFDNQNRSAFHIHLSIRNKRGENIFYNADEKYCLSKIARQFIGGILKYGRETSIIMASTYNSYKAYVIEREAPVTIGWGLKNRTSMVRLPYFSNRNNMRIELRNPDPAGNVYLQMAVFIGMGLKGIEENLDCGEPDTGSNYEIKKDLFVYDKRFLPKCMFEALMEAEKSDFLKELLGKHIYENYMSIKIGEWEKYRTRVTEHEHERYLMI